MARATMIDCAAYLDRIKYNGSLAPGAATLRDLQVAHLLTVPFENLSIHAGELIVLDDRALFDKVVRRRRGGFCYELNGLFAALLRELGFKVSMLSAGAVGADGAFGPAFDHMALLVTLEERWLVDVGFGDSFREPLRLDVRTVQEQGDRAYRIDDSDNVLTVSRRDGSGDWRGQYRFTLEPHVYADYAGMCLYHQTSPQSHFTRQRLCSRATPDGRITLSGTRLIVTSGGERREVAVDGEHRYAEVLREHFGIVMPAAT
jgi:N-hydroxyarylamine O-acetyltransferase